MDILREVKEFIREFNEANNVNFKIDSIRIDFSKEYKLPALNKMGEWVKIGGNSPLIGRLRKRLDYNQITTAYRLKSHDIYYFNFQDAPKYRKARLVIFGLAQYHKTPTPSHIVKRILDILKDVREIDICLDMPTQPNFLELANLFELKLFKTSCYINNTHIPMINRILFYDKALKNNLSSPLWRMEAVITIPNWKILALPLSELTDISKLVWSRM